MGVHSTTMDALNVSGVMAGAEEGFGVGSSVGPYVLVRQIGHGGMGAVYEGVHRHLEKRVAVKALHLRFGEDPVARERFHREGRAAARVRHPNAVEVFDCGIEQGVAWLAMEFLEGEDLGYLLEREGVLGVARLTDLMLPVVAAVAAAHEQGIVHRDLKPENIFLAHSQHGFVQPKVLDFGVARVLDENAGITRSTTLLGTPYYMSPEQTINGKSATVLSDQYSIGVMLYECVTGQLPFDRDRLYELMSAIVRGPLVAPREIRPDVPADFEAVILRAMHRAPGRRFPTMRAFGEALLPFASAGARALWTPVFDVDTHHRTIVTYDAIAPGDFSATISDASVVPVLDPDATAPHQALPRRRRAETELRVPVHAPPRALLAGFAFAAALALVVIALGLRPTPASSAPVTAALRAPNPAVPTGLVAVPIEAAVEAPAPAPAPAPPAAAAPTPRPAHRVHPRSGRAAAHPRRAPLARRLVQR
jgi:serine/threonine-protein kinase